MKKRITSLLMFFLLAVAGFLFRQERDMSEKKLSDVEPPVTEGQVQIEEEQRTDFDEIENSELQVHFVDVGQGDCTLIICDGHAMLIDAGEDSKGTAIQLYLQKQGISGLDYVIATHPDADHIGGMDVILTKFDCGNVLLPDCANDTKAYRNMIDAMEYRGYQSILPVVGDSYELGGAVFTVMGPEKGYEDLNNNSVCIRLVHGKNSFVFTGDAEIEAESDMIDRIAQMQGDVLKVAHHGSSDATTVAFLQAVLPQYAVISCGEGNTYGHPHAAVLNRLRSAGVKVFRTDEQGSIIAFSDGEGITFNCAPSESWLAGENRD